MKDFMRRQQARHKAARKVALGVVSDVEIPSVLLNDNMNNVEVTGVVLNKKTLWRKKKTCDAEVPEAARKFAFGVVSDVEVPGVLLYDKMNICDVPVVVTRKNTVGRTKNICDVEVHGAGIHYVEVPAVGLEKKIYYVEVPAVGMRNIILPTAKKMDFTDAVKKENNNLL